MATKKVIVAQDEINPIPVEIIAASIKRIDQAARTLLTSGLTQKCLITLLHYWCNGQVTRKQIETVLESLSNISCNIEIRPVVK